MSERRYQAGLKKRIKARLPGCLIVEPDPSSVQGIPDLLVLYGERWGMLEVKASHSSPVRPNQEHYITEYGEMSFAAFIFPENEDEVLNDLQQALGHRG